MNGKKLLIVGIDPGMTTAYAVLDIEGNFIHSHSSKQFDLNMIISETIRMGKAILVGTDKAKIPMILFALGFSIRNVESRTAQPRSAYFERRCSSENYLSYLWLFSCFFH